MDKELAGQPIRLNVGCGMNALPGWLNLDNSLSVLLAHTPLAGALPPAHREFAKNARIAGVKYGSANRLPLASCSADVIYASHVFEHLSRSRADRFLQEAMRVLRPGGVLRLSVPDLARAVRTYLRDGDADAFVEWSILSSPLDSFAERIRALLCGTRHHLWLYDGPSLCRALVRCGFAEVAQLEPGASSITDPGALDLHERANESVYVEGRRPRT